MIRKSDIELDTYWVTHSGYFRLATTVELGMGIADGKILYYHGVSEGNKEDPALIKGTAIPQICPQMPSLR